jgi:serine/threonine-protein kinase
MPSPDVAESARTCPSRDVLLRFTVGNLPGDLLKEIANHIESCARCVKTLETLQDGSDPLVADLRQPLPPGVLPDRPSTGPPGGTAFPSSEPTVAAPPPPPAEPPAGRRRLGRFQVVRDIARGGMGAVVRAHDPDLNREVAVKVLLDEHAEQPDWLHRFVEEAQIAGQLQHPGVVPVYEFGRLPAPDGRPFFAMKLVKGQTLAELLAQRSGPAQDLPRFLGVFEQVCQAVAFAHSKRVIHRDLKPANVMVGSFGEVQVMDWGLAKVLGEGAPAAARPAPAAGVSDIRTARSHPGEGSAAAPPTPETEAGTVLGTPAYMAPEQARGEVDSLDQRSDVFGLGSILCEILTGRPPYRPAESWRVLHLAALGDLADAVTRLDDCGADGELVALTKECLSPQREQRPPDAAEVARRVAAYRQGVQERLQATEQRRVAAQARAEEEIKRRRLAWALAAAGVLICFVAGGGYVLYSRQGADQERHTALQVNQALGEATILQKQAIAAGGQPKAAIDIWEAARKAVRRAEEALEGSPASPDLRATVDALAAELLAGLEEAQRDHDMLQRLEEAHHQWENIQDSDFLQEDPARVAILGHGGGPAYAAAFREYGIDVENLPAHEAASRIRQRPIHSDLTVALDGWCFYDPKAAADRLLKLARAADPDRQRNRVRDILARNHIPDLAAYAVSEEATELPSQTLILIADLLRRHGHAAKAVGLLRRARDRYPKDFWVNDMLGLHLLRSDPPDYPEAARCFAAAAALRPHSALGLGNLASVLLKQGDLDGTIAMARRAVQIQPENHLSWRLLATAYVDKGDRETAVAVAQEALKSHPDSLLHQTTLAEILHEQGQPDLAIRMLKEILDHNPEWVFARLPLAEYLGRKGDHDEGLRLLEAVRRSDSAQLRLHTTRSFLLRSKGDLEGALNAADTAVKLYPGNPDALSARATALKAMKEYDEALQIRRQLVVIAPGKGQYRFDLAEILLSMGRKDEALHQAQEAVRLSPALPQSHRILGTVLFFGLDRHPEAAEAYRRAMALQPSKSPWLYAELGGILLKAKDLAGAEAAFRTAIQLKPQEPGFHNGLGNVLFQSRHFTESIPCYREAIRLKPSAQLWINLGNAWLQAGNQVEAADACRHAAMLDATGADIRVQLSRLLRQLGKSEEALKVAREAVRLDSRSAAAHNTLGLALEAAGVRDEAIAEFREAVQLNATDAVVLANLGKALFRIGQHDEAARWLRESIRLRPEPLTYGALAYALRAGERYRELAEACGQAAKLEPANSRWPADMSAAVRLAGDYDQAEKLARNAIALAPQHPNGYSALGRVCLARGQLDQAANAFRAALVHSPTDAVIYLELGRVARRQKRYREADAAFRLGLLLDPRSDGAHLELGIVLLEEGRAAEAEAEFRKGLELAPQSSAHYGRLSATLVAQGRATEAVAAARTCLQLSPVSARARAWFRLGDALLAKGDFAEALAAFHEAKRLRRPIDDSGDPLPWDHGVPEAVRCVELDGMLAALEKNEAQLTDAARLAEVARFCQDRKGRPGLSAWYWNKAFTTDPKLAEDLTAGHRFRAACAAARTGCGEKGKPATLLFWRKQARTWLRADLALWAKAVEGGKPERLAAAARTLSHWQKDTDLAGVRDARALARLPDLERRAWANLWAEVAELVRQVSPTDR